MRGHHVLIFTKSATLLEMLVGVIAQLMLFNSDSAHSTLILMRFGKSNVTYRNRQQGHFSRL